MTQLRSQRVAYKPGDVVPWNEISNWKWYCDSGIPIGDEPSQAGKAPRMHNMQEELETCMLIHKMNRIWNNWEVLHQ